MIDTLLEKNLLPDCALRFGIRRLLTQRIREETAPTSVEQHQRLAAFADALRTQPIAINTAESKEQHYEVPTAFYQRVLGHLHTEDGRYQQLRRDWAANFGPKMFRFFQFQALVLVALSVPFLLAAQNTAPALHPLEYAAAGLWLLALLGETLADAQLARFKRAPANRGLVCAIGLWGWSRHPNYFFEWLVWVAFALFALTAPSGWIALYAPALMLFFLLKVTGVGYTEGQLLRSKGEAYRAYQARTSAFIPWPPRRGAIATTDAR